MKKHLILTCIYCVLLVSFLVPSVLAATVTCPSDCSCLLPAEAKKLGYTGYCNGKQAICGYDAMKNEKYCYEKTVTTVPFLTTTKPFVTPMVPTAPVPVTCPSGCSCYTPEEGKQQGYALCAGKQTLCAYDTMKNEKYCYEKTVTTPALPTPVMLPVTLAVTAPGVTAPVITLAMTAPGIAVTASRRCMISGDIFGFYKNTSSLKVRFTPAGVPPAYVSVSPVMAGDLVSHYTYTGIASCNGVVEVVPVYQPVAGVCPWTGTFTPLRGTEVSMDDVDQTGWDFTYVPQDSHVPEVEILSTPPLPRIDEDIRVTIRGQDDVSIASMTATLEFFKTDGTRPPSSSPALTPEPKPVRKAGDVPSSWSDSVSVSMNGLARIDIRARVCDPGGNERWGSATVWFGSCDDNLMNRDEQQIDCGGAYCPACTPCTWCGEHVIPLRIAGRPDDKIDVVFIPDIDYGGDMARLSRDVQDTIINGYLRNTAVEQNRTKFNFYYLNDEADVTGFDDGALFTPPLDSCESFQDATTFADSIAVVHVTGFRDWAGQRCGRRVFTSEPTSYRTFVHESGHSLFGVKDEYCCDSGYRQNDPNPNIWSSRNNCRNDANAMGWDPDDCDNFCPAGSGNCGTGFWDIDPPHCIMACSQSCDRAILASCGPGDPMCQFEEACERRVNDVFSQYP
ncbi:MAG: hypothetical protein NTY71_05365 [Methanoregula sp.]|nr:hypothetical protein [Methanoregula sp.]